MYTADTSLPRLYIRKIIPDDVHMPIWGTWPYRGGAMLNFAITEFYEVRIHRILGTPMLGVLGPVGHDGTF
jgi:hypothetical protein